MGLATAKLLASEGALISLADINAESLQKAVQLLEHGDKHLCTVVDVRDSAKVGAWIDATMSNYGKLDGAVNMAGIITPAASVVDMTDDAWALNFDVNAQGVFNCLRAQLTVMGPGASIVRLLSAVVSILDRLTLRRRSRPQVFLGSSARQAMLATVPAKLLSLA